jgi:hypothetical protein
MSAINGSKKVPRTCKVMKDVAIQDFRDEMKMLNKSGNWCIQMDV